MSNIVKLFVEISGGVKSATIFINMVKGSRYTPSRLTEWMKGSRQPSPDVLNLMLSVVVPYAATHNRLDDLRLVVAKS